MTIERTSLEISTGVDIDYDPDRLGNVITVTTWFGEHDNEGVVQRFGMHKMLNDLIDAYTVGHCGSTPPRFPTEGDRHMVLKAAESFRNAADYLEMLSSQIDTLYIPL